MKSVNDISQRLISFTDCSILQKDINSQKRQIFVFQVAIFLQKAKKVAMAKKYAAPVSSGRDEKMEKKRGFDLDKIEGIGSWLKSAHIYIPNLKEGQALRPSRKNPGAKSGQSRNSENKDPQLVSWTEVTQDVVGVIESVYEAGRKDQKKEDGIIALAVAGVAGAVGAGIVAFNKWKREITGRAKTTAEPEMVAQVDLTFENNHDVSQMQESSEEQVPQEFLFSVSPEKTEIINYDITSNKASSTKCETPQPENKQKNTTEQNKK